MSTGVPRNTLCSLATRRHKVHAAKPWCAKQASHHLCTANEQADVRRCICQICYSMVLSHCAMQRSYLKMGLPAQPESNGCTQPVPLPVSQLPRAVRLWLFDTPVCTQLTSHKTETAIAVGCSALQVPYGCCLSTSGLGCQALAVADPPEGHWS